jgi:uncharacterized sulfatase
MFICLIFSIFIPTIFQKIEQKNTPYSLLINKSQYFYNSGISYLTKGQPQGNNIKTPYKNHLFPGKHFLSKEYPLLAISDYSDNLSSFFRTNDTLPNFVFIIVEGLGERFIGKYNGINFMPFLDHLISSSLYWDNVLATSERSYGALPAILSSTPYGEKGFAFIEDPVYHFSLLNLLSKYDYYTSFFYGQPSWFDHAEEFFQRNGTHRIEHAHTFPEKYSKIMVDDYFWGYHDQDLAKRTLKIIDSLNTVPRIDIIYTGSMHPPFILFDHKQYEKRIKQLIKSANLPKKEIDFIEKYMDYFASILFSNDAIEQLVEGYKQHPEFKNSIFIITGDHNMSNIPPENTLEQYHVPLIIYSPLLVRTKTMHSINSHLDIVPSLLALLHSRNGIVLPHADAFIGKSLDTAAAFHNLQPIVLMNDRRTSAGIVVGNYLLSQNKFLFSIDKNFELHAIQNDSLAHVMRLYTDDFTKLGLYSCQKNCIIPDTLFRQYAHVKMIEEKKLQFYRFNKEKKIYDIIKEKKLTKKGLYYFDFSYIPNLSQEKAPKMIIEVKDLTNNKSLFWQEVDISQKNGKIHILFSLQETDILQNNNFIFNACFWNNHKNNYDLLSTSCALYQIRE